MLFHNKTGQLVEILRKNYTSDITYYTAIMKLKGYVFESPQPHPLPLGLRL
jgi:hypothetical protein